MTDTSKTVFISYRRSVTRYLALLMFKELRNRGYDTFLDVESIGPGRFERIILTQIEAREHFIVLLAHGTLDRCREPGDWLRREVEQAIRTERNVIPVLVDDFGFADGKKYLTDGIARLPEFNETKLYFEFFDAGILRLCEQFLTKRASGQIVPTPADTVKTVEEIIRDVVEKPAPTPDILAAEQLFVRALGKQTGVDLDSAIADYTEALRLNPDHIYTYYNRGNAYTEKGDLDNAIADYTEAIDRDPDFFAAYNNRGNTRVERGKKDDLDNAIVDFEAALRINPNDFVVHTNLGIARAQKGEVRGAILDLTTAISLEPDLQDAYYNRGIAREMIDDLGGAISDYTEAIRLKPDDTNAYYNRGAARAKKGDLGGAVDDYTKALHPNLDDTSTFTNRGEVYFRLGEFFKALLDFQIADALRAGYPMSLGGLAITHHALGNVAVAEQVWRVLVDVDERYLDADWVKEELNWQKPLVDEARKVIALLT